ncbi:chemotaxis protein CheB [Candidatus Omnitrophota bacterium]
MIKRKHTHKQDTSWIWLCSLLAIFFISLIVCYGRGSLRANGSYHETVSSVAESTKLTPYTPPTLKSLIVHPESTDNYFDFILDTGSPSPSLRPGEAISTLEPLAKELIDYFFLGITLPSEDLWVNLNSVRQNAITSPRLALTDIGKVLLEADLNLKKDCCRFTDPRTKTGKEYWGKLQARLNEVDLNTSQLPIGNRFWIIPEEAVVEEDQENNTVTIVNSKLKVCLQQEYLELRNNQVSLLSDQNQHPQARLAQDIADFTMKEVILPAIQEEVNHGKAYAKLRQVYNSLILAEYYKQKYHHGQGLYPKLINRAHIDGLESSEPWNTQDFYQAYVKSAQEGEYKLTQQEYDPYLASMVQKYYFYGGILISHKIAQILEVRGKSISSLTSSLKDVLVRVFTRNHTTPWKSDLACSKITADRWTPSWGAGFAGMGQDKIEEQGYKGKIIVIGGSAFSWKALYEIVKNLPEKHPPIVVSLHVPPKLVDRIKFTDLSSRNIKIIDEGGSYELEENMILIGHYLEIQRSKARHTFVLASDGFNRLQTRDGSRDNSVNPLFISAVNHYGEDVIAAILTGGGTDGFLGAEKVYKNDGIVLAQDHSPFRPYYFSMPQKVITSSIPCQAVAIENMASQIMQLSDAKDASAAISTSGITEVLLNGEESSVDKVRAEMERCRQVSDNDIAAFSTKIENNILKVGVQPREIAGSLQSHGLIEEPEPYLEGNVNGSYGEKFGLWLVAVRANLKPSGKRELYVNYVRTARFFVENNIVDDVTELYGSWQTEKEILGVANLPSTVVELAHLPIIKQEHVENIIRVEGKHKDARPEHIELLTQWAQENEVTDPQEILKRYRDHYFGQSGFARLSRDNDGRGRPADDADLALAMKVAEEATALYSVSDFVPLEISRIADKYHGEYRSAYGDLSIYKGQGILIFGDDHIGKSRLAYMLHHAGADFGGSDRIDLLRVGASLIGGVGTGVASTVPLRYRSKDSEYKDRPAEIIKPSKLFTPIGTVVFLRPATNITDAYVRTTQKSLADLNQENKYLFYRRLEGEVNVPTILEVDLPLQTSDEQMKSVAEEILARVKEGDFVGQAGFARLPEFDQGGQARLGGSQDRNYVISEDADWSTAFSDNTKPLKIEVGFGVGEELLKMAQNNPEFNYIGIEVESWEVRNLVTHLKELKKPIRNLKAMRAIDSHAFAKQKKYGIVSEIYYIAVKSYPAYEAAFTHQEGIRSIKRLLQPGGKVYLGLIADSNRRIYWSFIRAGLKDVTNDSKFPHPSDAGIWLTAEYVFQKPFDTEGEGPEPIGHSPKVPVEPKDEKDDKGSLGGIDFRTIEIKKDE